ncbi:hypothetical protein OB905_13040 [Halobacteria archaeon AArc-dxtr1]|nr:hypothetical protein [Halobacteria archaeon AArc-dxtr1]
MTLGYGEDGFDEDSHPPPAGSVSAGRADASPRAIPDGGQVVESDSAEGDDDEPESESAADDESEDEAEDGESASEDEAEDESEDEAEDEGEESKDEGGGSEENEEDEYHVEDAEDVYEGDDASGVLHLDLDGLFLDLLGLEVNLNPVTLDVSARPGESNLLGNLLSTVTGLLDGPSTVADRVKSMLGSAKSLLKTPLSWLQGLKDRTVGGLRNLAGKPMSWLQSLLGAPASLLGLGSDEGEESEADEEAAEDEEATDEEDTGEESDRPSILGRLKSGLAGLVPGFPLEEIIATIVSSALEQLLDQLEPENEAETDADAPAESQEAHS